ncbi:MAG: peptidylprolyl isomerase [Fusobacteriaceae bacterium]|nr:peptidylprolyl isomerase [Fusobacteriaceae bacterium]
MFIFIILALAFVVVQYLKKRSVTKLNYIEIKEAKLEKQYNLTAIIKTTKGDINLTLKPEVAPVTVANFVNLAKRGYYNGIKFHRVIADFMVQGGDPTGTGAGGPGYNFKDEFVQGVEFTKPGILAMANAGKNTNGSQFFITHVPTDWLNYKHTIFGEVVSAEDQKVVNAIAQGDVMNEVVIEGDVDAFLVEVKEAVDQFNSALDKE